MITSDLLLTGLSFIFLVSGGFTFFILTTGRSQW